MGRSVVCIVGLQGVSEGYISLTLLRRRVSTPPAARSRVGPPLASRGLLTPVAALSAALVHGAERTRSQPPRMGFLTSSSEAVVNKPPFPGTNPPQPTKAGGVC